MFEGLKRLDLSPTELREAQFQAQAAPTRMDTLNAELSWGLYPEFPVSPVVASLQKLKGGWDPQEWLEEELKCEESRDYRISQLESLDQEGVIYPVFIMYDSQGFDIGDGWHRIAWSHLNNKMTIPAYVGFSSEDLTGKWY